MYVLEPQKKQTGIIQKEMTMIFEILQIFNKVTAVTRREFQFVILINLKKKEEKRAGPGIELLDYV
mgnify:CR=1 FL=1